MPLLQEFGFIGFPPFRTATAPPRRPRNQADNPSRGRPPGVCSPMTSGSAANGAVRGAGGSGTHNGCARGHMSPIKDLRRHCRLTRPRPVARVSTLRARLHAARWGCRSRGWLRGVSRRGGAGTAYKRARAHPSLLAVTLCGRTRGHQSGARTRGRVGSAAPSTVLPPALLPASRARRPRSPARVGVSGGGWKPPARFMQRQDIHLAWQALPRGRGGARPPPYRRAAAGTARSR